MHIATQKITPCLCFDDSAEEAANFYVSVFENSRILGVTRCGENEPSGPPGSVRTVSFKLSGQDFLAVNGGPHFEFNDGVSLMVNCETQDEIDELWEKLSEGGEKVECGWLIDRFGMRWQVVPAILADMIGGPDAAGSQRVMQAVLKMKKLDIKALKRAYEGSAS